MSFVPYNLTKLFFYSLLSSQDLTNHHLPNQQLATVAGTPTTTAVLLATSMEVQQWSPVVVGNIIKRFLREYEKKIGHDATWSGKK